MNYISSNLLESEEFVLLVGLLQVDSPLESDHMVYMLVLNLPLLEVPNDSVILGDKVVLRQVVDKA